MFLKPIAFIRSSGTECTATFLSLQNFQGFSLHIPILTDHFFSVVQRINRLIKKKKTKAPEMTMAIFIPQQDASSSDELMQNVF